jgi:diguanylate cyclase (GGDEF)-like protein
MDKHTCKSDIQKMLQEHPEQFNDLCVDAENVPEWFYAFAIQLFTSVQLDHDEARKHYTGVLEHKARLSEALGRDAGLPVAMLDYFLNITRHLDNPKAVEIALFEEILHLSKIDSKTGCYNFGFFKEMLEIELQRAARHSHSSSVILIDLDDFKQINETYGHLFADNILEKMVYVIKHSLRREDLVARYGGDEFVVLLPHTGRAGARFMGERLRTNIIEYFSDKTWQGEPVTVTFSGGIATYPMDAVNPDDLINCADRALFRSKKLGKNCVHDYAEEDPADAEENRRTHERHALEVHNSVDIRSDEELISLDGRVLNISDGGALLECSCGIDQNAVNRKLQVAFRDLEGGISVEGAVVRVNRAQQDIKFYVGVQFSRPIDSRQWRMLEKSIEPGLN